MVNNQLAKTRKKKTKAPSIINMTRSLIQMKIFPLIKPYTIYTKINVIKTKICPKHLLLSKLILVNTGIHIAAEAVVVLVKLGNR